MIIIYDSWIGDGFCDKACNTSACDFDYPDCLNATSGRGNGVGRSGALPGQSMCAQGCPSGWLADKVCDVRCDNEACAWDMGDCGLERIVSTFPGALLGPNSLRLQPQQENRCAVAPPL